MLLHGIGSASRSWRNQLSGLSDRFRVIAWDAPGYAQSTPLRPETPDAGDYAMALLGFLDTLGVGRCHLVGHSLGTLMAARFAALHADRLLSLTLSSIAVGHAHMAAEERSRLLQSRLDDIVTIGARAMAEKRGPRLLGSDATSEMRQAVIDAMAQVQMPGYGQASRMLSGGDALADIARIPAWLPVQIIYGEDDVITPPAANLKAATVRPQAQVQAIPAAGHALYLEKPERFTAILADFAEAHDERN
ncbi:MAG: alpha/beta fold hydrolase [Ferrovibrio sp.]|uniref:alpha/beta fold hydrolase n=1 Tax=Ferrovibrio sp. TaxID=1917215 RepID=UPI00260C9487|nr:alpha/beta fold hydrolase [Ferrovibrio sp.]MCW0234009.1 alpha/beta fold hydrolase [Ferrovibrio sp.]